MQGPRVWNCPLPVLLAEPALSYISATSAKRVSSRKMLPSLKIAIHDRRDRVYCTVLGPKIDEGKDDNEEQMLDRGIVNRFVRQMKENEARSEEYRKCEID